MVRQIVELALAPGLVGAATRIGDRWGQQVAGLMSGLPVVVGPLLLIAAQERGLRFAAASANGVLLGLPTLGGFALAYALAARRGAPAGLLWGWVTAAALAAVISLLPMSLSFPAGLIVAAISLTGSYVLLPRPRGETAGPVATKPTAVLLRIGVTAALVLTLWAALAVLGPTVGGILAGLPTVVSVLVFFVHRDRGADAAESLLRGAVAGMAGFVGFCAVVGWLLTIEGSLPTFLIATAVGVSLQALGQRRLTRAGRTAPRRTVAPAA
jgi:hypothetical protein